MALLHMTLMSTSLLRSVPVSVLLPAERNVGSGSGTESDSPFKTLYLLHGINEDHQSWLLGSRIARLAERKNLAVVMPSGDNGFYVDHPGTHDYYGKFIGEELVDISRRMFNLSRKREDTYIAGLSMGGFGALRNGLKYHNTFSRIAAFSSALVLEKALEFTYDDPQYFKSRAFLESCFGDIEKALASDKNPKTLAAALSERKRRDPDTNVPAVYLSCGIDDSLLDCSREFRDVLKANSFSCDYYEGPGAHDWDFWDQEIVKAIEWLQL